MRLLFRAFVLLIVALPLLAIAAIAACLQDRPLVTGIAPLTPQDIERAKRIVNAQVPRRAGPDGLHTVAIDARDLGLALNYLARRLGQGAARVVLRPGTAALQVSLEAPQNPIGRYVNIDAALREAGTVPRFDHLKIGRLPVPGIVADFALRAALRRLTVTDRGQIAASVVKSVRLRDGGLVLTYRWSDEVATFARAALVGR